MRLSNGVQADSNGHSEASMETEPRTLAEVAETSLVRDVLCACQVHHHYLSSFSLHSKVAWDPVQLIHHPLCRRPGACVGILMWPDRSQDCAIYQVCVQTQGFDGHYVRYNPRAVGGLGGFDIAPEAGIPRVQRQLMLRICELGWLFRCRSTSATNAVTPHKNNDLAFIDVCSSHGLSSCLHHSTMLC